VSVVYALLLEVTAVVVIAPLAGVALAVRDFRGLRRAVIALALLGGGSLASAMLIAGVPWQTAMATHLTLGTAAIALAVFGAWCGATFRDPLDAAACSVAVVLLSTCGLFALGSLSADLPTPLVNAALLANPIVAVASAANIDLLRFEFLYQISPIAHGRFDYPAWYLAAACFSLVSLMAAAGVARARRFEGLR
jgi:hypothetical protein